MVKQLMWMAAIALATGACSPARSQQSSMSFSNVTTNGGAVGLHIGRPVGDPCPNTLIFDYGNQFAWGMGLDSLSEGDYTGTPDLVLAFSRETNADNLRLRSDDARAVLGPRVGHPVLPFQFSVMAGTPEANLGGIGIGTYGWQHSLYMFNRALPSRRTVVNFYNLFAWGTDSSGGGDRDFWLANMQTGTKVLTLSPDNRLGVNVSQLGFYGATPTAKPVVTGSWSDGSAAKSVLQALVKLGLVENQTTE
jgi:hypothetical protein